MNHKLCWHTSAWEDYLNWSETDKTMLKKINNLIKATDREPFSGIGKPEPLKNGLQGFWSRWINREHRFVYSVDLQYLTVISCRFHYSNP